MVERRPLGSIPRLSAFDCLKNGLLVFLDDLPALVVLGFGLAVLGVVGPMLYFGDALTRSGVVLFYVFIGFPLEVGFAFICLRAVRSGGVKAEHLFAVLTHYREVVLAGIFVTLLVAGGAGFFVLPGVYLYLRTRFVPYLLLEDELDAGEAIRESFRLTRDITPTLFGISVVGFATYLLGGFGGALVYLCASPALAWWHLSVASLYHAHVQPPTAWEIEDEEELRAQRERGSSEEEDADE